MSDPAAVDARVRHSVRSVREDRMADYARAVRADARRYAEAAKRTDELPIPPEMRGNAGFADVRFSVRSLTDGRRYVSVTDVPSEFRAAKDIGEKRKIVGVYIRKRWKGKVIDEDGVRAFVNGSSAHEYTNPAKKTGEQVFSDKLDAASELEAIVATSTNPAIIPDGQDGHVHKGVKEWEHRDVMFSVDGRFYTGRVNIKVLDKTNAKGESQRLLHDVTGLKDITGEVSTLIDHSSKEASNSGEDVHIITNPRSKSQGASSESPLKPSSERSASADKPRSSVTLRRSVGLANVATALFAQQMLAGKEVSAEDADGLLRNIGLGALARPLKTRTTREPEGARLNGVEALVQGAYRGHAHRLRRVRAVHQSLTSPGLTK